MRLLLLELWEFENLLLPTILVRTQIRYMLGGGIGKFTSGKNKVTI